MLAYLLALVVGLGSFGLYMAAFFFPEVHRKNDFIWSGVGLFYALVLWVCAERITGGLLLGQTASVALLGWLGWQTLNLRRHTTPLDQQTPVPTPEELKESLSNLANPETLSKLPEQIQPQLNKLKQRAQDLLASAKQAKPPATKADEVYVPLKRSDFASASQSVAEPAAEVTEVPIVSEPVPVTQAPEAAPIAAPDVQAVGDKMGDKVGDKVADSAAQAGSKLTEIANQFQSVFKGLTQKKAAKPVYVRKQYRAPESESDEAIDELAETAIETVATVVSEPAVVNETAPATAIVEDSDVPVDEVIAEEIEYEAEKKRSDNSEPSELKAVPPHPPSPDLVEAAKADAQEKHLPADPPDTAASGDESRESKDESQLE